MTKELDHSRTDTRVIGDSRAKWYQDGVYYNAKGEPITEEEAGLPDIGGPTEVHWAEQRAIHGKPSEAEVNAQVQAFQPPRYKGNQPRPPADWKDDVAVTRAQLDSLPFSKLAQMVRQASGPEFKGQGAKTRAVDWLMERAAAE